MAPVRLLVADVLKPHDPGVAEFARKMADVEGVDGVNVSLVELDREVQNVKLTVEGADVSPDRIEDEITELGGSLHSVDQVACGESVVEERSTPQD